MKRLNMSFVIGAVLGIVILVGAIAYEISGKSALVFLHPVAIFVVLGGILAAALISVPAGEIRRIFERSYYVVRFPRDSFMPSLREALRFSVGFNKDPQFLEENADKATNVLLRDGLSLITMGFKTEDIRKFMEVKRNQNEAALGQCSVFYASLAKMGPAFGLLGTLIGLIILLYYHMSAENMDKVASSMGIALTATLYGVGVANLIFSPLAEYLQYNAEAGLVQDEMILEAVIQIKERRHPVYLLQTLKAFMPREDYAEIDRMMQEELLGSNAGRASGKTSESRKKTA
jgi:chemotaxis protein MotA